MNHFKQCVPDMTQNCLLLQIKLERMNNYANRKQYQNKHNN